MAEAKTYCDSAKAAQDIVAAVGKNIVLALPLGIGKANRLANALYQLACEDSSIRLHIYTALTLQAPHPNGRLARAFLEPLQERFFAGYPALEYAEARRQNALPDNITVTEFFLQPAAWLGEPDAQQNYAAINYTHALNFLLDAGVNLVMQLVAPDDTDSSLNLSCNPDITPDLLKARSAGRADFLLAGELNRNLPVMAGQTRCDRREFSVLLDSRDTQYSLFMPPRKPVSLTDHAIALHTAGLIKDGGTLQIGIGSISDAICHALILRHTQNATFNQLLQSLGSQAPAVSPTQTQAYLGEFTQGLYGLSEMLVEGFLPLLQQGIVKREVDGALLHAGFFMGSPGFYQTLQNLPADVRKRIHMMPVSFINELYGDEQSKRQARRHARFINCAIMTTLTGAVVADGLENGQVISGVGGQYNFVAQSHALGSDSRSIITLRATRTTKGKVSSNIVWNYGHCTIPRHLRDMVVTEYGVADLRGKSDAEVIATMLNVTDSRFQAGLLKQAQQAGKIHRHYQIPQAHRRNTPEALRRTLGPAVNNNLLPSFPLGSEFSQCEQRLSQALTRLKEAGNSMQLISIFSQGLGKSNTYQQELQRLQLTRPGLSHSIMRTLVSGALSDIETTP
ncbi:acetyl-CoA hydrolase/transferase C-terminal domain-containing protein [Gilvimarinus sp. DA14]|uniref:acetyl-CoA hydrolase/transferase C-terminal domain-containing protein n=1 Tax=Gilvimarinus sp. DA14 TaxID=2956798 RepID=UPI0020B89B9C|nr:acetyl-CoA hydrolase/transferase C-terminal domain-containing protein [Gilvimarinus sp. DA14]UTF61730.1 acetyl-CoA hydrolase [Gilvimarinus sp. DA14]